MKVSIISAISGQVLEQIEDVDLVEFREGAIQLGRSPENGNGGYDFIGVFPFSESWPVYVREAREGDKVVELPEMPAPVQMGAGGRF